MKTISHMSGRDHTTSDAVFRRLNIQIKTAFKSWQCLQCCFILYEFNISQKILWYITMPCTENSICFMHTLIWVPPLFSATIHNGITMLLWLRLRSGTIYTNTLYKTHSPYSLDCFTHVYKIQCSNISYIYKNDKLEQTCYIIPEFITAHLYFWVALHAE